VGFVDSDALTLLRRVLGIAGRGAGRTDLDEGNLAQVVDVNPIVRRSRSLVGTDGIFMGVIQHDHGAGATTLATAINPYRATNPRAPWIFPGNRVPDDMEIWLIAASMALVLGTGSNFTSGTLDITVPTAATVMSSDEAGGPVPASALVLAMWDTIVGGPTADVGLQENGSPWWRGPIRIRRNTTIRLRSGGINAVEVQLMFLLALTPISLGQDVM